MKLKTRLMITFLLIIILPIVLIVLTYNVVRLVMKDNFDIRFGMKYVSMSLAANPTKGFGKLTDDEYTMLLETAATAPKKLADEEYLDRFSSGLSDKASCLLTVTDGQPVYESAKIREEVLEILLNRDEQLTGDAHGDYLKEVGVLVKKVGSSSACVK